MVDTVNRVMYVAIGCRTKVGIIRAEAHFATLKDRWVADELGSPLK